MRIFQGTVKSVRTRSFWVFALMIGLSLILSACGDELTEEEAKALAGGGGGGIAAPNYNAPLLLLGEDSNDGMAAVAAYLSPYGFASTDQFNVAAGTPTLAALSGYDSVLLWSDLGPNDSIALGNVLLDYVNGGGGLVLATYMHTANWGIDGNLATSGLSPFLFDGTNPNDAITMSILQPGHPVMNGVTAISSTSLNSQATTAPGANVLATWGGGRDAVAINSAGNIVGITFYPEAASTITGDWQQLIANALAYTAAQ